MVMLFAIAALGNSNAEPLARSVQMDFLDSDLQPSEEEFLLAAKRTFYTRGYGYTVINERTVRSVDKKTVFEIRRLDNGVQIRYFSGTDSVTSNARLIDRYLNNLKRDLVYELARYLL